MSHPCVLCQPHEESVLWRDPYCRVVAVGDPTYPGFCRVVWNAHVAEMTDLAADERERLMSVVWATERTLRELLQPTKVNLASLGNQVPHLHWHVIPRFADDAHFPAPIWAPAARAGRKYSIDLDLLKRTLLGNLRPAHKK